MPAKFSHKFSPKKIGIFSLVILVLVAVVGLVFLVLKHQLPLSGTPAVTPTPELTVSPIPDFAADWQIYTNRQYGYSVYYPQEWKLDETKPNPPDLMVKIYSPRWQHWYPWGVSVNITLDSSKATRDYFDKLSEREEPFVSDNKIEESIFAGVKCLKVTSKLPKAGGFGPETFCLRNNFVYKIQTFVYSPSTGEEELGDQILLTFRFLN